MHINFFPTAPQDHVKHEGNVMLFSEAGQHMSHCKPYYVTQIQPVTTTHALRDKEKYGCGEFTVCINELSASYFVCKFPVFH